MSLSKHEPLEARRSITSFDTLRMTWGWLRMTWGWLTMTPALGVTTLSS